MAVPEEVLELLAVPEEQEVPAVQEVVLLLDLADSCLCLAVVEVARQEVVEMLAAGVAESMEAEQEEEVVVPVVNRPVPEATAGAPSACLPCGEILHPRENHCPLAHLLRPPKPGNA